jgi:hypothetical protein
MRPQDRLSFFNTAFRRALLVCALAATAAWAQPASEPGDLWEDTTETAMSGMPAGMAGRPLTHRRCSPRNSDALPMADQSGGCEMTDVRRSAKGMAWKMRCQGNPPMTGSGEISYEGRDRYTGAWTMDTAGRTMTMKMSGRRIGECDASEARRQLAAVKQQVAAGQRQVDDYNTMQCKSGVDNLMSQPLRAESQHGCGAKYKADFCRRLQTPEGFAMVAPRAPSTIAGYGSGDLKEGAEFCGTNHEEISARVCRNAEEQESLEVLSAGCVARGYGRALVVRECAGRNFSSPPAEKYLRFCGTVAANDPSLSAPRLVKVSSTTGTDPAPAAASSAPSVKQEAIEKGKQLLKGLFGR